MLPTYRFIQPQYSTVFTLHDYLIPTFVRHLRANFAWSKLTMNCMKSFSYLAYLGEFKVVCIESTYIKENRQFKSAFNMVDFFTFLYHTQIIQQVIQGILAFCEFHCCELHYSQVPNKRVGWKKFEQGNIQKKTDKETEKSIY